MAEDRDRDTEPTQDTPQGQQIPVPKRADVLRDMVKVAKANKPASDTGGSGAEDQQSE